MSGGGKATKGKKGKRKGKMMLPGLGGPGFPPNMGGPGFPMG